MEAFVIFLLMVTVIVSIVSCVTKIKIVDQEGSAISKQDRDSGDDVDLDTLLNKLADKIKSMLDNNDPYTVPSTDLKMNNKLIRVSGSMEESQVLDASSTRIKTHTVRENETYFIGCNVTMNLFHMMGKYALDLYLIEQVYITGEGDFRISLDDINMMTVIEVTENDSTLLKVKDLHLKYDVGDVKVAVSGLFGGGAVGKLVGDVLNDLVKKIVTDYNPLITRIVREIGRTWLKSNIDGLTMTNVTEIIQQFIDEM
ncbi:uncharacterized protein LOC111064437 [Nilaparvata lugens]|uniref:uncharacterized protein LOC111064437 n=1 Tax=Nilaparvata lugens TaxID=108931 RepID=UPI00193E99E7|nr:uncharacterized protein LOC111064437 [Nilaparvata lugens]